VRQLDGFLSRLEFCPLPVPLLRSHSLVDPLRGQQIRQVGRHRANVRSLAPMPAEPRHGLFVGVRPRLIGQTLCRVPLGGRIIGPSTTGAVVLE
ncbi:MAG TPA: hypothetical protein VNL16_04600, partial [Chloroflexota bacterium]|nr:hypothetical protein [Chloroflexota bacterium]